MDDALTPGAPADRRRPIVGLAIMIGLVALAILIISLDEILAARVPMVDVHAELAQTEGLVAGAPVWIAGHEVGEVISVTLLPPRASGENRVVVTARIPESSLPLLRADSHADVASARLMGDPVLALSPGSATARGLAEGDTILPEHGPDRFGASVASARSLLLEVDTLLVSLRQVGTLYQARRPMIDRVMRSVDEASAELERTSRALEDGPLTAALADARLAERFARVRASLAELQAGLGRYASGPLGDQVGSLRARADSLRADLAVLDSLASDPTAGFIGRMRTDSALAVEGARTRAQMDTLVEEVMSNPLMFF